MLTRRRFLALSGFTGIAAAGMALGYRALPSDSESSGDGPPSIALGSDSCDHCNMIISDARFAAAWRDARGKPARFDDIGCMVSMYHAEMPANGTNFWVHSYLDESLLTTNEATFVVSEKIVTPMSYGIAAVASTNEAGSLVQQFGGETKTWAALLATGMEGGH